MAAVSAISCVSVAWSVPVFIDAEQIRRKRSTELNGFIVVIMLKVMRVSSNGYHYGGLPQVAQLLL